MQGEGSQTRRAVVIGAGLAGLAAAMDLRRQGWEVTVLEKHTEPGGKARELRMGKYRFDRGPSLLTMKPVFDDLIGEAGFDPDAILPCERLEVACRYHYPDGTRLDAFTEGSRLADEIAENTTDSAEDVHRFLAYARKIYERTKDVYLFRRLGWPTLVSPAFWRSALAVGEVDPFRTMNAAIEGTFRDERTRNLFRRFATYNGSNPLAAPATLNIISHVEQRGVWLPKGGIHAIPQALYRVANELGVAFRFGANITAFHTKGGRVRTVVAGDHRVEADVFVSNLDRFTAQKLLPEPDTKSPGVDEISTSTLLFYWGVRATFPELEVHNIFFPEDYPAEFRTIWEHRQPGAEPTIYVNVTSKRLPSDAPPGRENWFVLLNLPAACELEDSERARLRQVTLRTLSERLGRPIEPLIEEEACLTPGDLEEETGSFRGSLYGRHSNSRLSAFLRPGARSGCYGNLYYAGGTVHPGGGMPLAILSGRFAAQAILEDAS